MQIIPADTLQLVSTSLLLHKTAWEKILHLSKPELLHAQLGIKT